ncbi:MAG: hypothetical protein Q8858_17125, partial [Bacteroidota bacterium]|nr:hypothetical protein [Bacteroidota bacterium]
MQNLKLYFLILMIFSSCELISQPLLTSNNIVSNNIATVNSNSKTSQDLTTSHALNVSHDLAIQDRPGTDSIKLTPFSNLWGNITESFTGWDNILLQLAGVASTFAISSSNLDNHISTYFRDHESYKNYASPAVILGSTLPITTGAFLYIYGKLHDDNRMVGASF